MKKINKFKSFEELLDKRRRYVQVSEENNISLYNRLTRIYPDKAHFIYELLQNAEDMQASVVEFKLEKDRLIFKHNGKKRDFNLNDIIAITGIDNNDEKKNDKTAIGKFGIGFKSVFAYTDTPEIHSGQWHFKIEDIYVPTKDSVDELPIIDENKVKWTIFVFPFNRKEKPPKKAYAEIKESLEELDYCSILFLQNIKRINYYISQKKNGFVKLIEDKNNNFITTETADTKQKWLRFTEMIDFEDENRIIKSLPIGLAFRLDHSENTKTYTIIPVQRGKTFVYFPAIKEYTGLRFHINGPFATTESRDSVINCSKNKELINKLSELIVKSLKTIKELGFINKSFIDVLPNDSDIWYYNERLYEVILNKIKEAFKDNEYLPTLNGEYVNCQNALMGSKKYSDVINQEFLESVAGINKKWIINANTKFLHSLDIEEFNSEKFLELFDYNHIFKLESYLSSIRSKYYNLEKSKHCIEEDITDEDIDDETIEIIEGNSDNNTCNWFKEFYKLTINEYSGRNKYRDNRIVETFKRYRLILSESLNLLKHNEIYLESNTQYNDFIEENKIEIVNSFIINENNTENEVYKFFKNELKIKDFDEEDKIKWEIDNNKNCAFDENKHIEEIVRYWSQALNNKIDLKDEEIFVSFDGENYIYKKASSLADNKIISKLYNKPLIWDGYKEKIPNFFLENIDNEIIQSIIESFKKHPKYNCLIDILNEENETNLNKNIITCLFSLFLRDLGMVDDLIIEKIKAEENKLFITELDTKSAYHRGNGANEDYTIINVKMMFDNEYNKILWDFLKKQNENKYTKARYSPNKTYPVKECDSTLIYELKNNAWLPDKEGKLHKPDDISLEDLRDDFKYEDIEKKELVDFEKYPLIKALEIGAKPADVVATLGGILAQYDMEVITKDDMNELKQLRIEKAKRIEEEAVAKAKKGEEEAKEKARLEELNQKNIDDIFFDECRDLTYDEDDLLVTGDGAVIDVTRRGGKIIDTFTGSKCLKPKYRKVTIKDYMTSEEEKTNLKEFYNGVCQICGWKKLSSDGKPIFEGINMIRTSSLPEKARNADNLCWNSLCLCPNCAAEYKNCSLDISDVPNQVKEKQVNNGDSEKIEIKIFVNNESRIIKFVPKHFLALQKVLSLLKNKDN